MPRPKTPPEPMRARDSGLFIGGVADGRRTLVDLQLTVVKVEGQVYQRDLIAGDTQLFAFWRPRDMPIDEALACLFERYTGASSNG